MKEIERLINSIAEKTNCKYCERLIKIFGNMSEYDSDIIKEWLKIIDEKL